MAQDTQGSWALHYRGFMIIFRPTTIGRTPLDERSAQRRDSYLINLNNQKRRTCTLLSGFDAQILINPVAPNPRLRQRGHWDRQWCLVKNTNIDCS